MYRSSLPSDGGLFLVPVPPTPRKMLVLRCSGVGPSAFGLRHSGQTRRQINPPSCLVTNSPRSHDAFFLWQDPSAAVASSTSAGCTADHLAGLVGFVLRCHLEAEELADVARRQVLNTGQVRRALHELQDQDAERTVRSLSSRACLLACWLFSVVVNSRLHLESVERPHRAPGCTALPQQLNRTIVSGKPRPGGLSRRDRLSPSSL